MSLHDKTNEFYNKFNWKLPYQLSQVQDEANKIFSWDWNIYYKCPHCSVEMRIDPSFYDFDENSKSSHYIYQCSGCKKHSKGILIQHHCYAELQCLDCSFVTQSPLLDFNRLLCRECGSSRITKKSIWINPNFPTKFYDCFNNYLWGKDVESDISKIFDSLNFLKAAPDYEQHLLHALRFARRLRLFNEYSSSNDNGWMLNCEANLLRNIYKHTHEDIVGVASLEFFLIADRILSEISQMILIKHNICMAAYSLLTSRPSFYWHIYGFDNIRLLGISAAKEALELMNSPNISWNCQSLQIQESRIRWTLADIISIDQNDQTQIRIALSEYDKALTISEGIPEELLKTIRMQRSLALINLDEASNDQLESAVFDLNNFLSSMPFGKNWILKSTIAYIYLRLKNIDYALRYATEAENDAFNELMRLKSINILDMQINDLEKAFDIAAFCRASLSMEWQFIIGIEKIRCTKLRLFTRSIVDQQEREEQENSIALIKFFSSIFGNDNESTDMMINELLSGDQKSIEGKNRDSTFSEEHVKNSISNILKHLNSTETGIVVINLHNQIINAAFIFRLGRDKLTVNIKQWSISSMAPIINDFFNACEPSIFRETRLRKTCYKLFDILFKPILNELTESKVKRIGLSLPGFFIRFPFDSHDYLLKKTKNEETSIFLLPSIELGNDVLRHTSLSKHPRALIVGYVDSDLPHTKTELKIISDLWGENSTDLLEKDCTKLNVIKELQKDYDYIHFSCHGTFNELHPLDSALHLTANTIDDSKRITARDLMGIHFKKKPIVVLSACVSALTPLLDGTSSALTGLVGGFLSSGALSVIGTRWPVYDLHAKYFVTRLNENVINNNISWFESFQLVRNEMAKKFPFEAWAAFCYIGLPEK